MYKVIYLPIAKRELEDAVAYIAAELLAPYAAYAFADALDEAVRALAEMPHRHPIYHSLFARQREIRFFPVKNYNVYYVIHEAEKVVEIYRVLYGRQNTTAL